VDGFLVKLDILAGEFDTGCRGTTLISLCLSHPNAVTLAGGYTVDPVFPHLVALH
jgi:hypothetical protein